jgi:hypothetical protein
MLIEPDLLLSMVRRSGFTVSRSGDNLIISPKSKVTPEWLNLFKAHKPALLPIVPLFETIEKGKTVDMFCEYHPWDEILKPFMPPYGLAAHPQKPPRRRKTDRRAVPIPDRAKCPVSQPEGA